MVYRPRKRVTLGRGTIGQHDRLSYHPLAVVSGNIAQAASKSLSPVMTAQYDARGIQLFGKCKQIVCCSLEPVQGYIVWRDRRCILLG